MSGFFWNVRGFNKSIKHSVVKKWVQDQGFQFGALLETRVKEGRSQRISDTVFKDWNLMSNYEFNPLGRIWLVWRPEVRITPFYKTAQMITVSVALDEDTEEFSTHAFMRLTQSWRGENYGVISKLTKIHRLFVRRLGL